MAQIWLMVIGNLSLLAPDVFGNPIRFLAFSVIMLLMLQQSRNQERCFYTSQHWFLQWLEVLMPPYLCIGDSARLLAMVVLFNEKRLYLVYSHFFSSALLFLWFVNNHKTYLSLDCWRKDCSAFQRWNCHYKVLFLLLRFKAYLELCFL